MTDDKDFLSKAAIEAAIVRMRPAISDCVDWFSEQAAAAAVQQFGGCPHCHWHDGFINAGSDHWFYCEQHKVMWCVGSNLFSGWREQTEGPTPQLRRVGRQRFRTHRRALVSGTRDVAVKSARELADATGDSKNGASSRERAAPSRVKTREISKKSGCLVLGSCRNRHGIPLQWDVTASRP